MSRRRFSFFSFFILIFIILLLLLCCIGYFRVTYRCGELEDIHALRQRFRKYSFIPSFKTKGKLLFTEQVGPAPYRYITVIGTFDDTIETIIGGSYIHNVLEMPSDRKTMIFRKEEFAHISNELLSKYQIKTNDDGKFIYTRNPDKKTSYEIYFLANQVHCHFYLDQTTRHFVLHMAAR